jgi:hypothetical protein
LKLSFRISEPKVFTIEEDDEDWLVNSSEQEEQESQRIKPQKEGKTKY